MTASFAAPTSATNMRWSTWHYVTCLSPFLVSSFVKLLAVPAYHSTDFDVHANWLRITSSLPAREWYFDAKSAWTLDYPPLFAWFEFALTLLQPPADLLRGVPPFSYSAVLWHKLTVIVAEAVVLGGAMLVFAQTWPEKSSFVVERSQRKILLACSLVAMDPNLFAVDHVHFQYNGLLLGVLILGMALLRLDRPLAAAAVFAVLLGMKHIFLYAAPLLFVYYLRRHCWRSPAMFFALGAVVLGVLGAGLASVCVAHADREACVRQVFARLFPVDERGLLHAYWAPNFWALYAGADLALKRLQSQPAAPAAGVSPASGLVQGAVGFAVLPKVPPWCVTGGRGD
jgi:alpha-1,3-glucosyltransferase